MLPPSALLQLSSSIALIIGAAAFLGFNNLATGHASAQGLSRSAWIILMIALVPLFATLFLTKWLSALVVYLAATLVAWAYAISAGLTVAELLGHLKLAGWQMKPTHMGLIYWVIWFGLFTAPHQLGRARALYHLDPTATSLPSVELPGSPPDLKWRLVHIADGRALLISPAKERKNCTFRVIEAKDLPSISAAK